ncbi:hypothetical protein EXIGLDRAFT_766113 [Exidia glandulosa HHB12029]|uniref:F-box domain-containing protein n=1 Tax=Exidia glandulosa HHB12029 TaxID=1314781 RepID=A0A165JZ28_EXIGL|nr:hypothetical protein EXIGLDRAFT_766113 [Exidia glandulosa HHB12029]
MRRLPVELQAEIVQYLDPRELATVSTTAKGFQQLVTRLLYRHIVFHARSAKVHLQLERLFITLISHVDDIAPFVQHLDLDWDAGFSTGRGRRQRKAPLASLLTHTLPHLKSLTYLAVGPRSNMAKILDLLTIPTLREFHCAAAGALDNGFLSHHPYLARLSLCTHSSADHVIFSFLGRLPQGLEYLRLSSATRALDMMGRLPQGREAKLTRLDLRVINWWDRPDFLELLQLLRESFFTVSCINVFGPWAKDFLTHTSTVTVGHVTRAGVPCFELRNIEYQLPEILVGVARLFPNVRTLDILADRPFSYRDIARLVQATDGLQRVDRIVFPDGKAYSRTDADDFEPLATRVEDYSHILWPGF